MPYIDYLQAYEGKLTAQDITDALGYLEKQLGDIELATKLTHFIPEFTHFLASGDISNLAPAGLMSKEMFYATRPYVFCTIEMISGRTVLAKYMSGKQFTGVLPADNKLQIKNGPCVLIHKNDKITSWITMSEEELRLYGGLFNSVASKTKRNEEVA